MIANQMVHNGTRGRLARAASAFNVTSRQSTGDIWTPAAGNRFCLLGYEIEVTGDAWIGSGGSWTAQLFDGATDLHLFHRIYLPGSLPATPAPLAYKSGWIPLGTLGITSAVSAQALRLVCSATLQAGFVTVRVAGTEETPANSIE